MSFRQNISVFVLVFLVTYLTQSANGLSCTDCVINKCKNPTCCESGQLVKDVCGCCLICAKSKGQACGGPWGVKGTCSKDLLCFRSCECATVPSVNNTETHKCIFPFKYQGVTYNGCRTTEVSENTRWCAYEVDEDGVVVEGKWGNCNNACPTHDEENNAYVCKSSNLFNMNGSCVDSTLEEALNATSVDYAYQFDPKRPSFEQVPKC